jgi:hypothetical protein
MPDGDHSLQALVTIDGSPLPPELEPLLESVLVDDHLHLPDMFLLTFRDIDRTVLSQAGVRIGSKVVISGSALGEQAPTPLITGEVTAIEGEYDDLGGRAIVRGYDPSHRFHRGRHTETWKDATDADIVRAVAQRAGVEIGTSRSPRRLTPTCPRPTCRTGSSSRRAPERSATRSRSWTAGSISASRLPRPTPRRRVTSSHAIRSSS